MQNDNTMTNRLNVDRDTRGICPTYTSLATVADTDADDAGDNSIRNGDALHTRTDGTKVNTTLQSRKGNI